MSNIYNIQNGLEVFGNITGVTYYGDGSKLTGITLDQMSDVIISNPSTGNTLLFSAGTWINTNLDWYYISNKPNTVSGYGITDVYTTSQTNANFLSANTTLSYFSGVSLIDYNTYTGTTIPNLFLNYYTSSQTNANFLSANTYYFPILSATTLSAGTFYISNIPSTTTGKTTILSRDVDGLIKSVDISSLASGFLLSAGTILVGNSSGTAVEMPVLYNNYLFSVSNISSDGLLPFTIPAGYMIDSIVFIETTGSSAGNISISTTSGYTGDVIAELSLDANQILNAGPNSDAKIFSFVSSQSLYISSNSWGSSVVSLKILLKNLNE